MFEWKRKYEMGIKKFDDQHKRLFEIGRDLVTAFEGAEKGLDQYDHIVHLLSKLHDYTVYHFNSEEKALKKFNYPNLENHKRMHDKFIEKLENIDIEEIENKQKEFSMELLNFIADWIEHHIMGADRKYIQYMDHLKE